MPVVDPTWAKMREEAEVWAKSTSVLTSFLHATVLKHEFFEDALSYHLAQKLGDDAVSAMTLREVFDEILAQAPEVSAAARADINAVYDRDPACSRLIEPFLYFKGFHALQAYRIAREMWKRHDKPLALFLQSRVSQEFGVDIHPAATIGRGILLDHATGIVIGETAIVDDDVSLLHGVTLGGTGKETGDRHPKIRRGVLIGAGASVLGNIVVGECARVAACSVVLEDVPAHKTVAGIPAKVVGDAGCDNPSHSMDHRLPSDHGEIDGSSI